MTTKPLANISIPLLHKVNGNYEYNTTSTKNFISLLSVQPETGMGYQIVNVILRNGKTLSHYKVLNSELLVLNKDEKINKEDITVVELQK